MAHCGRHLSDPCFSDNCRCGDMAASWERTDSKSLPKNLTPVCAILLTFVRYPTLARRAPEPGEHRTTGYHPTRPEGTQNNLCPLRSTGFAGSAGVDRQGKLRQSSPGSAKSGAPTHSLWNDCLSLRLSHIRLRL